MALTNASRLADFGTGIGTQGAILQVDNVDQRVGIGTTDPDTKLEVKGTIKGIDVSVSGASTITGNLEVGGNRNTDSRPISCFCMCLWGKQ